MATSFQTHVIILNSGKAQQQTLQLKKRTIERGSKSLYDSMILVGL